MLQSDTTQIQDKDAYIQQLALQLQIAQLDAQLANESLACLDIEKQELEFQVSQLTHCTQGIVDNARQAHSMPCSNDVDMLQAIQQLHKIAQFNHFKYQKSQLQLKQALIQLDEFKDLQQDYNSKMHMLHDLQETLECNADSELLARNLTIENIELRDKLAAFEELISVGQEMENTYASIVQDLSLELESQSELIEKINKDKVEWIRYMETQQNSLSKLQDKLTILEKTQSPLESDAYDQVKRELHVSKTLLEKSRMQGNKTQIKAELAEFYASLLQEWIPNSFDEIYKETLNDLLVFKESLLCIEYLENSIVNKEPFTSIRLSELLGFMNSVFFLARKGEAKGDGNFEEFKIWMAQLHKILLECVASAHPERIVSLQEVNSWILKVKSFSDTISCVGNSTLLLHLNTIKKYHEYTAIVLSRIGDSLQESFIVNWISINCQIITNIENATSLDSLNTDLIRKQLDSSFKLCEFFSQAPHEKDSIKEYITFKSNWILQSLKTTLDSCPSLFFCDQHSNEKEKDILVIWKEIVLDSKESFEKNLNQSQQVDDLQLKLELNQEKCKSQDQTIQEFQVKINVLTHQLNGISKSNQELKQIESQYQESIKTISMYSETIKSLHQEIEKLEKEIKELGSDSGTGAGRLILGSPFRKPATPLKTVGMSNSSQIIQNLQDGIVDLWNENTHLKSLFAYSKYANIFSHSCNIARNNSNQVAHKEKARHLQKTLIDFQLNAKVLDLKTQTKKRMVNALMQCQVEYMNLENLCISLSHHISL